MDSQKVVDVIKTEFLAERQVVAQFDLVGGSSVQLCVSVVKDFDFACGVVSSIG